MITRLHQYARDESRSSSERERIAGVLADCLPDQVSSYLFEGGRLRDAAFDLTPLRRLIAGPLRRSSRLR